MSGIRNHPAISVGVEPHDIFIALQSAVLCDVHAHTCCVSTDCRYCSILLSCLMLRHLSTEHMGTVVLDLGWTLCLRIVVTGLFMET